jgi:hypothetical protein
MVEGMPTALKLTDREFRPVSGERMLKYNSGELDLVTGGEGKLLRHLD